MKKTVFYILLTAFCFGTMEVALKIGSSGVDPVQMTFLRFLIGGLLLLPIGLCDLKKRGVRLEKSDYIRLFEVGFMGIAVSMLAFQFGVERANAATAAALICMNPIFTMMIAHIFTAEKMNSAKLTACIIAMVAAFFMIRPWDMQEGNTVAGVGLVMLASVTFGAYTVMGKSSMKRIGAYMQTAVSFLFGSAMLFVALLATHRPIVSGVVDNWAVVLYVGVVVTGIGYMAYFSAIANSDASTGAIAFYIKPAIAPVLAVFLLGESVYWNSVVGIVLLMSASLLILRDAKGAQGEVVKKKECVKCK